MIKTQQTMKSYLFSTFLVLVASMVACTDNDKKAHNDLGEQPNQAIKTYYVSVYADKDCEQPLIENFPLSKGDNNIDFSLAHGLNEVYVKYPTAIGTNIVKKQVQNLFPRTKADPGTYTYFNFESHRYVRLEYTGEENATPGYVTQTDGFTAYLSSGVAMFEDTWPSKSNVDGKNNEGGLFFGDYNDLVIDYDLEANVNDASDPDQLWKEDLKVVIHIRAKGGAYPQKFGLKLEGVTKELIDDTNIELIYSMSNHQEPTEPLTAEVKWDGQHPVIYINDLQKLTDKAFMDANNLTISTIGTDKFYNTVNDENFNATKGLFTATVVFKGNQKAERSKVIEHFRNAVMNTTLQNFFIVTKQAGKEYEIHMAGYQPTSFYTSYKDDLEDKASGPFVEKDIDTTYKASDGNVWGIKTPVLTRHATEHSSFRAAFPEYEQWIKTKEENYALWYLHYNHEHIIKAW